MPSGSMQVICNLSRDSRAITSFVFPHLDFAVIIIIILIVCKPQPYSLQILPYWLPWTNICTTLRGRSHSLWTLDQRE